MLTEPGGAVDVAGRVHPRERLHHEVLRLLLGGVRARGDAQLGDPDSVSEARARSGDIFLESLDVRVRAVPAQCDYYFKVKVKPNWGEADVPVDGDEVHVAAALLELGDKVVRPVEVPCDGGAAELDALLAPRGDLLHPDVRGIRRRHVSLARDVRLVEGEEMFGRVLRHLGFAAVPVAPLLYMEKKQQKSQISGAMGRKGSRTVFPQNMGTYSFLDGICETGPSCQSGNQDKDMEKTLD